MSWILQGYEITSGPFGLTCYLSGEQWSEAPCIQYYSAVVTSIQNPVIAKGVKLPSVPTYSQPHLNTALLRRVDFLWLLSFVSIAYGKHEPGD